MKLQVLLATMNQKNDSVLDRMCVVSDVIVCNQNVDEFSYKTYTKNGKTVDWYNLNEKGVGLNRNNALMRATSDICLIADDDVLYHSDYEEIVLSAFERYSDADMILFNVDEYGYQTRKKMRVRRYNCGRFGGVRIAFRRMSVIKNAVCFNQLFGGGSMFSAGEDNMFIRDCIRKGLKVYAVPEHILKLDNSRESTWFKGYNDKFFEDLGSSYCFHYGKMAIIFAFLQLIRHKSLYLQKYTFSDAMKCVVSGIKKYRLL